MTNSHSLLLHTNVAVIFAGFFVIFILFFILFLCCSDGHVGNISLSFIFEALLYPLVSCLPLQSRLPSKGEMDKKTTLIRNLGV